VNDKQIQDIADQVIAALHQLAPLPASEPTGLMLIPVFAPIAALVAAAAVTIVGLLNLKHQQKALKTSVRSDAKNLAQRRTADATNLEQKRLADARSEWWRRTQWALEATADGNPDSAMYEYGTTMLDVLAKSDLAGPEEKAMLDAVWQGSATEMEEEGIDALVEDAAELGDLSEEQLESLRKYELGVNELTEEEASLAADLRRHLDGDVDVSASDGDNGSTKEDDNDLSQDVRPG
jgi:hypothetical protein